MYARNRRPKRGDALANAMPFGLSSSIIMVFGGKVFPNRRVWRFFRLFWGRPISPAVGAQYGLFSPYCPLGNTGFCRPISLSLNTGSGFGYCPLGNTPTLFLGACTKRDWRGLHDDIHLTSPPAYRPPPLHEWRGGIDRFTWMGGPVPPAMGRGYSPQPLTGFMWIVGYYIPKWSIQLMVCALCAHHFLNA